MQIGTVSWGQAPADFITACKRAALADKRTNVLCAMEDHADLILRLSNRKGA